MPASYPTDERDLNPQNTSNDGDVWPNPNLSQAKDYNVLDEELKAIADDLRAAAATESAADMAAALTALRSAIDAITPFSWTATVPATLASNTGYLGDTSSSTVDAELPVGTVGMVIEVIDAGNNSSVNNITITPNTTELIDGVNTSFIISTDGGAVKFVYTGPTLGWKTIN